MNAEQFGGKFPEGFQGGDFLDGFNNQSNPINEEQYPQWIIERVNRLIQKTGASPELILKGVLEFEHDKQHSIPADPNEPFRIIFISNKSSEGGEEK